jgi:hypothetical protein
LWKTGKQSHARSIQKVNEDARKKRLLAINTFRLKSVIRQLLLKAGIEQNPGPENSKNHLQIFSHNVRGLSSIKTKLHKIISSYRVYSETNNKIICMQEIHEVNARLIRQEWGTNFT